MTRRKRILVSDMTPDGRSVYADLCSESESESKQRAERKKAVAKIARQTIEEHIKRHSGLVTSPDLLAEAIAENVVDE